MAMYKIRRVRMDDRGEFRPVGKRLKYLATHEKLVLGGVYMFNGNEYYQVEKVF